MILAVPEGYTTSEYYFLIVAIYAGSLFLDAFIWYIYYGLPLTLAYIVFRVFRKKKEPLRLF